MTASHCRPARPWGPIPGGLAVVLGWWLVAHSSGQGWVQALGDVVTAGILVGLVGPWVALRRIRVELVEVPTDAAAGRPAEVGVRVSGPARLTPTSPAGASQLIPSAGGPSGQDTLVLVPLHRGVYRSLVVEVATAAPFGLQWWSRRVTLPLPQPLHVAPRRGVAGRIDDLLPDDAGDQDGGARRNAADGDLRAPRPYRPGDARRTAHWPATAHTGELMVRELEHPRGQPAELTVTLSPDPAEAEVDAGRYLGTVFELLDRDMPVLLTTTEEGGTVTARVADRREAARRLAAAL